MSIKWRPEMSIDGAVIDEDHRHLIEIINRFEEPGHARNDKKMLLSILNDLKYYAHYHFSREEKLQEFAKYPHAMMHQEEHRCLLRQLQVIITDFEAAESEDDISDVRTHTATLLRSWLIDHIVKSDLHMRNHVGNMKTLAARMPKISNR
jgi:hemerythrin